MDSNVTDPTLAEFEEFSKLAEGYEPYVPKKRRKMGSYENYQNNDEEWTSKPPQKSDSGTQNIDENLASKEELEPEQQSGFDYEKEFSNLPKFNEPLRSSWVQPSYCSKLTLQQMQTIRKKFNIEAKGSDIPCPLTSFKEMRLNKYIIKALKHKNIRAPTPVQIQGIPIILSGRDLVANSFTGSGKSLVFILPILTFALEQEMKMPFISNEGPFALILVPSRELGRQIFENIEYYHSALKEKGFPKLKINLCVGGTPIRDQIYDLKSGSHIMVATPGRLVDLLSKQVLNLIMCRIFCVDEADRLLDSSFDHEFKRIIENMPCQRQTLLFNSSTTEKVEEMARNLLIKPITIIIERGSAANLNLIQEVELVSEESKLTNLIRCVKKTQPLVIIFACRKADVQMIAEFLSQKEIDVVYLNSEISQEERHRSIKSFTEAEVNIMVTTDLAAKGLDLPMIRHVINYDIPDDINIYINRIGRTGKCGRTGLVTTFVTKSCDESILMELRSLLVETKQRIPQFLSDLKIETTYNVARKFCNLCNGRGQHEPQCSKNERRAPSFPNY